MIMNIVNSSRASWNNVVYTRPNQTPSKCIWVTDIQWSLHAIGAHIMVRWSDLLHRFSIVALIMLPLKEIAFHWFLYMLLKTLLWPPDVSFSESQEENFMANSCYGAQR